jgi:hypothetical protein
MAEPEVTPMDELLLRAARSVPVPDPDLFAAAVTGRIRDKQPATATVRAPVRPRRIGLLAAGLTLGLVVAVGVAPVRSAIADLLGIDGVHITRVTRLPSPATTQPPVSALSTVPVDRVAALHLGQVTTLAQAAHRLGFPMRLPTVGAYQRPDAVYVGTPPAGGMAAMVYLPRPDRPAVPTEAVAGLLTEFRGHIDPAFFQKLVAVGTTVEPVRVGAANGYFLSGAPHEFFYVNPDGSVDSETLRLAADTLVWSAGGITYRFESALPRDAAVALAVSMR